MVSLATKMESLDILDHFLSNPTRWKADLKAKNKDGFALVHITIARKSEATFSMIAKHLQQLVIPVGLQFS